MPGQIKIQPSAARFEGTQEVENPAVAFGTANSALSEYRMAGKLSARSVPDSTKDLLPVLTIEGLES